MRRVAHRVLAVLAVLTLVGCGGSPTVAQKPPTLSPDVANALAARADRVASLAEQGQTCRAAAEAHQLQQDTIAAVNAGHVPGPLQEPLQGAANRLAAALVCAPPPTTQQEPQGKKERGHGKKKGHEKHGGGGEGD
jgi:hypothetical protein